MATITWSEMMSVGVPALDADHKLLVGLINNLHRSVGDLEEYATLGSVLRALEEYVIHHFTREERVLHACGYPSMAGHARTHSRLGDQVRALKESYDADRSTVRARDCLDFLHQWLIDHICSTDMDYRAWVVGHDHAEQAAAEVSITGVKSGATGMIWADLSVLVVDDNHNFRQIMQAILENAGVGHIFMARDVGEAQSLLQTRTVDALVCDWRIGAENGLDLVVWARRQPDFSRLPILMLSGHEQGDGRVRAQAAGADEFMEKPISARGLLLCLIRLLHKDG